MDAMMNIDTYLRKKLKEKHLQIEDLVARSSASKSTIYRLLTGVQKPSKKLENEIVNILNLNHTEQQELHYYFSISDVDDNIIESREAVHNFLFKKESHQPHKIELIYYDNEKYIRTYDNILKNVLSVSREDNFTCQFKIINCIQKDIIVPLATLATHLLENNSSYSIEHLINFSTHDYKDNINTLANIAPILTFGNYSLKYREEENVSKCGFFHDFLILHYSYDNEKGNAEKMNLVITFLPDSLSSCYVINENNENFLDFFGRNYDSLKEKYIPALSSRKSLIEYVGTIIEMFRRSDSVIFRSDPALCRIPLSVYHSVLQRTPMEDFVEFFIEEEHKEKSLEAHIEELLNQAKLVEESTYANKQLDIYTKSGMAEFAHSGLIKDYLEFLPAFNKDEVKRILESIKARDKDPKDPFNFLILKGSYADEQLTLFAGDNSCLLFEKYFNSHTPFCIIDHEKLSSIFTDFAHNYVPAMMSIPQNEAYDYIDYLIKKYC